VCGPPAGLVAELGRAKRRADLEVKLDQASSELSSIQPARVANSDAKVLTRYLGALGFEVSPDRLNDLLVLLAVVTIETGGGLSLSIGMALSGPFGRATEALSDTPDTEARAEDDTSGLAIHARGRRPDGGTGRSERRSRKHCRRASGQRSKSGAAQQRRASTRGSVLGADRCVRRWPIHRLAHKKKTAAKSGSGPPLFERAG